MFNSSQDTESGVTSTVAPKLSPRLERAKKRQLSAVMEMPFIEALEALRKALPRQRTEESRLANLAAQSWVIRRRLEALQNAESPEVIDDTPQEPGMSTAQSETLEPGGGANSKEDGKSPEEETHSGNEKGGEALQWQKVRITKETEVNGMVFFQGAEVAVKPEDAQKLVESGKAEVVTETSVPTEKVEEEGAATAKPQKGKGKKPSSKSKKSNNKEG